jgi:protein-tyrosine phosphatase
VSGARCDLHCHYIPGVDDGVSTFEDSVALCRGLQQLGYSTVVATPHIRPGMFDNHKLQLEAAFAQLVDASMQEPGLPERGLAAEHFCDDTLFTLIERGGALPYPGGHAALIEFAEDRMPLRIEEQFFRMQVRGLRPVIAHPERYRPIWKDTDVLGALVERGALGLLDLMSLIGKYGSRPQRCAEDLLEQDLYFAACSDSHKPDDLPRVERGIARLIELVGAEYAEHMLSDRPRQILEGTVRD